MRASTPGVELHLLAPRRSPLTELGCWTSVATGADWDEAVEEVGQATARVWRLYLAGSRLGFVQRRIELHQVLAVRTDEQGVSGMPLERMDFSRTRQTA